MRLASFFMIIRSLSLGVILSFASLIFLGAKPAFAINATFACVISSSWSHYVDTQWPGEEEKAPELIASGGEYIGFEFRLPSSDGVELLLYDFKKDEFQPISGTSALNQFSDGVFIGHGFYISDALISVSGASEWLKLYKGEFGWHGVYVSTWFGLHGEHSILVYSFDGCMGDELSWSGFLRAMRDAFP